MIMPQDTNPQADQPSFTPLTQVLRKYRKEIMSTRITPLQAREEAEQAIIALLASTKPVKRPQVPGNKEPYINRGYIEGEVNGHNQALDEYDAAIRAVLGRGSSDG